MKTLAIIDPTSMVGSMVFRELKQNTKLVLIFTETSDVELLENEIGSTKDHKVITIDTQKLLDDYTKGFGTTKFSPTTTELIENIGHVDSVINCLTVVKPHLSENMALTFFINSAFPHILSRIFGTRLIHLSTDCVFSGLESAPYTEDSPVSPTDLYGLSRSLGEPFKNSLVFRTSTIGPEIKNFDSLIAWVKKQKGETIKGFTRHMWNGMTNKQFALIIKNILHHRNQYPNSGLYHIYGSAVSKFDMVTAITKKYQLNLPITADDGPVLDRRLRTNYPLNDQLHIPSFSDMLGAL